jgi:hypothetical protein
MCQPQVKFSAIAKSSWEVSYESPSEMTSMIRCKTAHPMSCGNTTRNIHLNAAADLFGKNARSQVKIWPLDV